MGIAIINVGLETNNGVLWAGVWGKCCLEFLFGITEILIKE